MRLLLTPVLVPLRFLWLLFCFLLSRRRFPAAVRSAVVAMGPVAIKVGQAMSTRKDVLSSEVAEALGTLRDHVPSRPFRHFRRQIERVCPAGRGAVFSEFDETCFSAGCIAQVYIGVLHDGQKVAVKVLRPRMDRPIRWSFAALKALVVVAETFVSRLRALNLRGHLAELRSMLVAQTDLRNETRNYRKFEEAFQKYKGLRVPRVYESLSSHEVLVTEFVEAVPPYDFDRLPRDRLDLARTVDHLFDVMIFNEGFCHADFHPGNFFWDTEGDLVLIDMGLMCELSLDDRQHFMTFYFALIDGFHDFAVGYFLKYFVVSDDPKHPRSADQEKALFDAAYQIVQTHFVDAEGKAPFSAMTFQLMKILWRFRVKLRATYSRMILTGVTIEGYLFSLDPAFDMMENNRQKRLEQAEYTDVPEEMVDLIVGEGGSYSTARFSDQANLADAFRARDDFVLAGLQLDGRSVLYDVGCGRGGFLERAKQRDAKVLGITISRKESEICRARGLDCIWSSWEMFDERGGTNFPKATAITAIEVLAHLASFHEHRVGLAERRLGAFFRWCHDHLEPGGRLFLQCLCVDDRFYHDAAFADDLRETSERLPWFGLCSRAQLERCWSGSFEVTDFHDHSPDLLKTYDIFLANAREHERRIVEAIGEDLFGYILDEGTVLVELARKGSLELNRIFLRRCP
jgi:predicted unusual protein kinase regulating ubiquinone biosynthesis (AarF/ABC1/UbiB family)